MKLIRTIPFEHNNGKYEIVIYEENNGYRIRAMSDNKPMNPWVYLVDNHVDEKDFFSRFGEETCEHLIKAAQSDIIENRWEKKVESLKKKKISGLT